MDTVSVLIRRDPRCGDEPAPTHAHTHARVSKWVCVTMRIPTSKRIKGRG